VLGRAVAQWLGPAFPYGTLVINVAGSVAIGCVAALLAGRLVDRPDVVRQLVIVGFLGSFTTFSAFTWETHGLLQDGEWMRAAANVVASVVAGLAGVRVGVEMAAWWASRT